MDKESTPISFYDGVGREGKNNEKQEQFRVGKSRNVKDMAPENEYNSETVPSFHSLDYTIYFSFPT